MRHRDLALVLLVAAAAVTCRDALTVDHPAGLSLRRQGGALACDFGSIDRLANKYFTGSLRQQARARLSLMEAAGARTAAAREFGFDVMALIEGAVVNGVAGAPTLGSDLTNQLILCMFDPEGGPDQFPAVFPVDFRPSLDPAVGGGYAVRGPAADATPVLGRGAIPPSGVAPPLGFTWSAILTERVLIYGRPLSAGAYDWSTIRPGASFTGPGALVGLCVNAGNLLVHEENVGLLPFQDAYFLPLACDGTLASSFARSVGRLVASVLLPRTAHAASLLNPGGVGGLAGGLRSLFSSEEIPAVDVVFLTQPLDVTANTPIPTSPDGGIVVRALAGSMGVPAAALTLVAEDNNGAPAELTCPALPGSVCTAVTNGAGEAAFGHPVQSKTGGYRLVIGGLVTGRTIPVNAAESNRFNVRP